MSRSFSRRGGVHHPRFMKSVSVSCSKDRGRKVLHMLPEKSPGQGSLIVAALIVLAIVFAGHRIVSYVQTTNPWAIIPWYGVAAVLIIGFGNLHRGGG